MSRDAVIETDFVITVAGRDVTKDTLEWTAVESEQKMSKVEVTLSNEERKNDGIGQTGEMLSIRFGEDGSLDEPLQFPIVEDEEENLEKGPLKIKLCGYDESQKLAGGKNKGNFDKDMNARQIADSICKQLGIKLDGSGGGPKFTDQPFGVYNEKWHQVLYRLKKQLKVKSKGGGASSGGLRSVFPKDKGGKPAQFAGETALGASGAAVGRTFLPPKEGLEFDENLASNNAAGAAGSPVTAELVLRGFPRLRAGKCITVLNVGSKYSGEWYAEEIERTGGGKKGSRTKCSLIRGGQGKGGAGAESPNVFFAKAFEKQPTIFMGQRDLDGESQATFTYGIGERVISFKPRTKPQSQRGAGEPGKGKMEGIDLLDGAKPYEAKAAGAAAGSASGAANAAGGT